MQYQGISMMADLSDKLSTALIIKSPKEVNGECPHISKKAISQTRMQL